MTCPTAFPPDGERGPLGVSLAVAAGLIVLALVAAAPAAGQESRCASCHFANPYTEPAGEHLDDWDRSPHGRNGVGCEACHGGDASTFESFLAHRDVLPRSDPDSPLHRTQIARTCGRCHAGPFTNFLDSRHFELATEDDRRGPTCTTCHGTVSARLLSPDRLERQCASCHGPDGDVPREGRPEAARALLEGITDVRASLEAARQLISRMDEGERRMELEMAYDQAEVPLIQAARAGHQFVYDQLEERLATARQRTAALLAALVDPQP